MAISNNAFFADFESVRLQLTIDERPDQRNIPIYVIIQDSEEVTSRWTRADAEHELQRLYAHDAKVRAPQ